MYSIFFMELFINNNNQIILNSFYQLVEVIVANTIQILSLCNLTKSHLQSGDKKRLIQQYKVTQRATIKHQIQHLLSVLETGKASCKKIEGILCLYIILLYFHQTGTASLAILASSAFENGWQKTSPNMQSNTAQFKNINGG